MQCRRLEKSRDGTLLDWSDCAGLEDKWAKGERRKKPIKRSEKSKQKREAVEA